LHVSPGGSTTQGAAPVTEHSVPVSWMSATQHSAPVRPGTSPQMGPPQTPQAASQQTSWLSIPARPLLQVDSPSATVVVGGGNTGVAARKGERGGEHDERGQLGTAGRHVACARSFDASITPRKLSSSKRVCCCLCIDNDATHTGLKGQSLQAATVDTSDREKAATNKLHENPPVWSKQGGATVSLQTCPEAKMAAAQHRLGSTPGMIPQPSPPQEVPHSSGQHTSVFGSWTPVWPLLQVSVAGAASAARSRERGL